MHSLLKKLLSASVLDELTMKANELPDFHSLIMVGILFTYRRLNICRFAERIRKGFNVSIRLWNGPPLFEAQLSTKE